MGLYVIGTAIICGSFGFVSLHQFVIWWQARSDRVQLLFAICSAQAAIQLLTLLTIASTYDIHICQWALDIRTINGCLLCATVVWLNTDLSGLPGRRISIVFTAAMAVVAIANAAGYPFNGIVIGIDRIALPWGEGIATPIREAPGKFVAPIYAAIIVVQLLCVAGAIRLHFLDRVLGILLAASGIIFIAALTLGASTDLQLKKLPYAGPVGWFGWLVITYWLLSRKAWLRAQHVLASEHRLANLFKTSPDAICITRLLDGTIIEVNPAFERVFGWTRAESIGHSTMEIGVWQSQSAREEFVRQMRQKREILDFEFSFKRKNGTAGFGLVSTSLVEVDHTPCIQVVTRDLTDRQRFEEDRRRTERLSSLGLLASGVGHDFNNVLTTILFASEMVRASPDTKTKAWADRIIDAGNNARQLIKGLLQFARQSSLKAGVFDVHEAVKTAATVFGASGPGVDVDLSGLAAPRSRVSGYEASIQSAMLNLCLNARDAMGQGGKITISSSIDELDACACSLLKPYSVTPGQFLRLCVADTGTGMDAATLQQCFEPFFTTKGDHGTGLGLASVHAAVLEHRGAVRAESAPGNGAVFTIWLPLAAEVMNTQWSLPGKVLVASTPPQEATRPAIGA